MIEQAWEEREAIGPEQRRAVRQAVEPQLPRSMLAGAHRRARDGGWIVNQWLKKAVLLSFRLNPMEMIPAVPATRTGTTRCRPNSPAGAMKEFAEGRLSRRAGRDRPPRRYIAPGAVLMPSFVNIGAHVGEGAMIDTWATVGSCAQIGSNVHISGGAGIGGVLEPLQAGPVIIEDDCFIGARSEVAEGVVVERGSVLSMGVFLGASTKIVDRASGEVNYGRVPAYSVVVPGALPGKDGGPAWPAR